MLTIRFQRTGKKNRSEFRLIVAPKTAASQKKFHEILGNYNPRTKQLVVKDQSRLEYWISQNLEVSPSVYNLLVTKDLVKGNKLRAFRVPKKVTPKAEEQPQAAAAETPVEEAQAEAVAEPTPEAPAEA